MLRGLIMYVTGYYNENGYQVETDNPMDGILYQASNHALDSQQNGTGTKHQLSLETIKEYCDQTTLNIATELDAEYVGVEYLEQDEM